jgi:hypothetical protein
MSNYPTYIVLANSPKDHNDPIFTPPFPLHRAEWVIFDGELGENQAKAKAETYKKYFHAVQIRTIGVQVK